MRDRPVTPDEVGLALKLARLTAKARLGRSVQLHEQIAAAVGFETPATFRHHFSRAMRTSPSAYRRAFRPREAARSSALVGRGD